MVLPTHNKANRLVNNEELQLKRALKNICFDIYFD